jgi:hypothetical protein
VVFKNIQIQETVFAMDEYIISPVHLEKDKSFSTEHSGIHIQYILCIHIIYYSLLGDKLVTEELTPSRHKEGTFHTEELNYCTILFNPVNSFGTITEMQLNH